MIADPIRLGILRSLSEVEEATTSDLAAWGQASSQTLRRHLEALVALGVIREHPARSDGETPGRPAARFSLARDVRESVQAVFEIRDCVPRMSATQGSGAVPPEALASTKSIAASDPMNGVKAK